MGWLSRLFGGGKKEEAGAKMRPVMNMETEKAMPGAKTAKDPVCGMDVNMEKAAATSVYKGQTYYFCAAGCKKTFDENPAKYTKTGGGEMAGHGGGHHM